jgi:hypothetical protein
MSFGIKTKELQGVYIANASCASCNTSALRNSGTIKLFHVWGIPLFPVWASSQVSCAGCSSVIKLKNASDDVRHKANSVITPKALLKSSWGLSLLIVALIGLAYLVYSEKQEDQAFVAAPQAGDIYTVKIAEFVRDGSPNNYPYGIFKVTKVDGDKVSFIVASNTYGDLKSVRKSLSSDGKKADFYSDFQIESDLTTLKAKLDTGAINNIDR